ncbi:hypothetical protein [Paenibacillus sp. 22594]|uniref:hypothetical protein n=1 Tax=Paenibacillus sp. 22594 TaxID=3453947 RepID=UPI003F83DC4D
MKEQLASKALEGFPKKEHPKHTRHTMYYFYRKVVLTMGIQMGSHQKVLYQADNHYIQSLKTVRNHLHGICRQHANQFVRVQTLDGQVFTGRIVGCDRGLIYLKVQHHGGQRAFFGSSSDEMILTLVLYELLVITLLYT